MPAEVFLRPTTASDLPTLFQFQLDPASNALAGTKPHTEQRFRAIWDRILSEKDPQVRVIVHGDSVVGGINCLKKDGLDYVGYWIDRAYWGRGIATRALSLMTKELTHRPLYATTAKSNAASIRVLESCGFRCTGYHMGEETERFIAREVASFILE